MAQRNNFHSLFILAAILLLAARPSAAEPVPPPPWPEFVGQFIENYFKMHPPFAANAGRHEFDGRLPDWSMTGLSVVKHQLAAARQDSQRYRDEDLTPEQRIERKYLQAIVDKELFWLQTIGTPYKNPLYYSDALDPTMYVTRNYAPAEQRMRAYIAYLRSVPTAAAQIRANLQPPFPTTFIDVGKRIFTGYADFYTNDAKAAFTGVDDLQLQEQFVIATELAAKAMHNLTDWLSTRSGGASFVLGPSLFREMLRTTEQIETPLADLEKMGRDDLQRNQTALQEACHLYAPDASVAACAAKVEAQRPTDGAVAEARRQLPVLKAFLAEKDLLSIPGEENAGVAEAPPFNRWNSAYIDIPGPYEHNQSSVYYVAPPDPNWAPAEQASYLLGKSDLLFVSAHEVWPGHFLQHLHAKRSGLPLGQLFHSYAFSEGWAHYAEELLWETGFNAGDPETHIGQLLNALLRDVRFLAAIGMHTKGMTVAEAETMFKEQAYRDPGNARQQAARGTFDPAYLNYTLGKLLIRQLREDWTAHRGGRAAWKAFHDAFLSYGAPPIPLVRHAMLNSDGG